MRVLIVDDEKIVRQGLMNCINWRQYGITEIDTACNGKEAIEKISIFKPDLALLDVVIPIVNGIDVAVTLQKEIPISRVIFISGYDDIQFLKLAFKVDAIDYIFKPVDIKELEIAVAKAIDNIHTSKASDKNLLGVDTDILASEGNNITRIVGCVKQFINQNYTKDITINVIAQYVYLTPNYVSSLFKKETGVTVMDYVTQLRMEKAKELLKDIKLKVYEIADMVGYKDPNYFAKLFKKFTGYNPSEYRDAL